MPKEENRRRQIILSAIIALYAFGLVVVWGTGLIFDRPHGLFTAEEIRLRSEPICRQFNAPRDPALWTVDAKVAFEGTTVLRQVWNVDCTGAVSSANSHGEGAYLEWDADTGSLRTLSNASVQMPLPAREAAEKLSAAAATRASQYWLKRLAPADAGEVWMLAGAPVKAQHSWQVKWQSDHRVCRMLVAADTGELIIVWLRMRKAVPETSPLPPAAPPDDSSILRPVIPVPRRNRAKLPRAASVSPFARTVPADFFRKDDAYREA